MSDVTQAITLDELLAYGQETSIMSIDNTSYMHTINNNSYLSYNIFDSHMDLIKQFTIQLRLTDEDYLIYRFNPKQLSYRLYGTVDLWYLLLKLNHMTSPINFNKRSITIFNPRKLNILNEIYINNRTSLIDSHNNESSRFY